MFDVPPLFLGELSFLKISLDCSFCLTGALYLLVHSTAPLHLSACLCLCRYASGLSTLLGEPHQSVLMGNSFTLVNKGSFRVTVKHNHLFHAVRGAALSSLPCSWTGSARTHWADKAVIIHHGISQLGEPIAVGSDEEREWKSQTGCGRMESCMRMEGERE